jgi:hypothetical protein
MRALCTISLLAVSMLACQAKAEATAGPDPGCTKDVDCKGDRICTQGQCGPPPITNAPMCPPCAACPDCASPPTTVTSADAGRAVPLTDVARARALLLTDPAQAKFILENRLTGKPGTQEEYRVLREACRSAAAYDKSCIDQCTRKITGPKIEENGF